MFKKLILSLALCLGLVTGVQAADYYFANCTGSEDLDGGSLSAGSGDQTNPFCMDPDGDGIDQSIMLLFDGTTANAQGHADWDPEAAAGDNVYLCSEDCDATDDGADDTDPYFRPNCTAWTAATGKIRSTWFAPLCVGAGPCGGTDVSPITIQPHTGETVIVSGDHDGDDIFDDNGVEGVWSGTSCTEAGWDLTACTDDDDIQTMFTNQHTSEVVDGLYWKDIVFEKVGFMFAELGGSQGMSDWTFDGVTMRYSGGGFGAEWDDGNGGWSCAPSHNLYTDYWEACHDESNPNSKNGFGAYGIVTAHHKGPFTVKNSTFHSLCAAAHRNIQHLDGGEGQPVLTFDSNEYYNHSSVNNDFGNISVDGTKYATHTWKDNTIHDVEEGIVFEDRNREVVIQDNIIYCDATYRVRSDYRCNNAIKVGFQAGFPGGGAEWNGKTFNVTIQRNKIYGKGTGWWLGTLWIDTDCDPAYCPSTGANFVVENNFIWGRVRALGDHCSQAAICIGSTAGLNWTDDDGAVVRNNTIWDVERTGIEVAVPGVGHVISNNIVLSNDEALYWPTSHNGTIANNIVSTDGLATVVVLAPGNYTCSEINAGLVGGGTVCDTPTLVDPYNSNMALVDLHLSGNDTIALDNGSSGTSGQFAHFATDDIDKYTRTAPYDIGADEIPTVGVSNPDICGDFEFTADCPNDAWTVSEDLCLATAKPGVTTVITGYCSGTTGDCSIDADCNNGIHDVCVKYWPVGSAYSGRCSQATCSVNNDCDGLVLPSNSCIFGNDVRYTAEFSPWPDTPSGTNNLFHRSGKTGPACGTASKTVPLDYTTASCWKLMGKYRAQGHCSTTTNTDCWQTADCPATETCTIPADKRVTITIDTNATDGAGCVLGAVPTGNTDAVDGSGFSDFPSTCLFDDDQIGVDDSFVLALVTTEPAGTGKADYWIDNMRVEYQCDGTCPCP